MDEILEKKVNVCKSLGGKPNTTKTFKCEGIDDSDFKDALGDI